MNIEKDFEVLDLLTLISLIYQIDSNAQLREQSTNDDILHEIRTEAKLISSQLDEIISLLKEAYYD